MGQLVDIDIQMEPGETRSGVQALNPKIFARYEESASRKLALVLIHPVNNFMNHYLVSPLAARGAAVLAVNTRYAGNETFLILERAMLDLGAAIRFLRAQGYERICLIGNSGGAALSALYQAEAESKTITHLADGRPINFTPADIPPIDRLVLLAAHPGRSKVLTTRLDASVIDERDVYATDPDLDVFSPAIPKPFESEFVARVRAAQIARNRRISAWCQARLREFRRPDARTPISDQIFTVYRTMADPRFTDLALEPNGRALGTALESDAAISNYGVNATAAVTTLTSWLSQWSLDHSVGDGPRCLSRISTPTLSINLLADEIVYPSDAEEWRRAAPSTIQTHDIPGVGHYPQRVPGAAENVADIILDWAKA
jgi:pimeloyl-ACP methyl ester carboxylesterase